MKSTENEFPNWLCQHRTRIALLFTFLVTIIPVSSFPATVIEKTKCESPLCLLSNQTVEIDKKVETFEFDVCLTEGCKNASSEALERMNFSINPCDDFYKFACGKSMAEKSENDDMFTTVQTKLNKQLYQMIEDEIDGNDLPSYNVAKRLYKPCMDNSSIEQHGVKPLLSITDKLGGWPVVLGDKWDDNWNWMKTIEQFNRMGYGVDYIFELSLATDLKDSTKRVIYINQDDFNLDREYLMSGFDNEIVKAYYEYMVDVAVILGANREQAEIELKESLEFEMKLANISISKEELRNYSMLYNAFTIKELQESYPYIQWLEYINALLPPQVSIDENEIVVVSTPTYFEKLGDILKETPRRVIANYLIWCITEFSSFFLTNELRKRRWDYIEAVYGDQGEMVRWKQCVSTTDSWFSIAVGAMYVRKYFQENSKASVLDMVNRIRNEFEVILKKVDWMDEETRLSAIDKLHRMTNNIGYPDELLDDMKIGKYYENMKADEANYLSFALSISKFYTEKEFAKLRDPVNRNDWESLLAPFIVNAYYSYENIIRPRYMNFGAIGYIIGHEITHGFDDEGSQFDFNGNLVDWWHPETKANYLKRVKCIIAQYGNYTEPLTGLKLNGVNTQGENIADNGGIKEQRRVILIIPIQKPGGPNGSPC